MICQNLKILWHWNFNMGVNRKPKMWNISKRAVRRVKEMKIWNSGYCSALRYGNFADWFFQFGLKSFGALCTISILRSSKHYAPPPNFHPNFIEGILIMGQHRLVLFSRSAENYKIKAPWNFLNTLSYGAGNFKSPISPTSYIEAHPNFVRTFYLFISYSKYNIGAGYKMMCEL